MDSHGFPDSVRFLLPLPLIMRRVVGASPQISSFIPPIPVSVLPVHPSFQSSGESSIAPRIPFTPSTKTPHRQSRRIKPIIYLAVGPKAGRNQFPAAGSDRSCCRWGRRQSHRTSGAGWHHRPGAEAACSACSTYGTSRRRQADHRAEAGRRWDRVCSARKRRRCQASRSQHSAGPRGHAPDATAASPCPGPAFGPRVPVAGRAAGRRPCIA